MSLFRCLTVWPYYLNHAVCPAVKDVVQGNFFSFLFFLNKVFCSLFWT